ncbi:MAG TPA: 16S rRNA (cytosine(1402)-N(4))-methyltransferase RsmH [Candidatus Dojkabacteria bacterium]|nr:16S rRNA (cytosine(1402)-N(4))-methyltransferase RsmH [Candidatus Dojkabacteria bacterium]HQF36563.1 16S rRNA (cytosine(1402)-N(4))-methyltransferase RsmH [Candidatus Dojkabacteria bacterium]
MVHTPVLLDEAIEQLNIKKDGIYVDATLGDGGHSTEILKNIGSGRLISIDCDINSIDWVKKNNHLATVDNWIIEYANFSEIEDILKSKNIQKIDGILFDIGLSSRQLANKARGFSYYGDGAIDMRMDDRLQVSAKDLLMALSAKELTRLFNKYGEEKYSAEIARSIVRQRKDNNLNTIRDLVQAIYSAVPQNYDRGRKHPARRVFQALRIAVNDEIFGLEKALTKVLPFLNTGGRIVVITYHSLEEKVVQKFIQDNFEKLVILTPTPIKPSPEETERNQRARSAKMYVIEIMNK